MLGNAIDERVYKIIPICKQFCLVCLFQLNVLRSIVWIFMPPLHIVYPRHGQTISRSNIIRFSVRYFLFWSLVHPIPTCRTRNYCWFVKTNTHTHRHGGGRGYNLWRRSAEFEGFKYSRQYYRIKPIRYSTIWSTLNSQCQIHEQSNTHAHIHIYAVSVYQSPCAQLDQPRQW